MFGTLHVSDLEPRIPNSWSGYAAQDFEIAFPANWQVGAGRGDDVAAAGGGDSLLRVQWYDAQQWTTGREGALEYAYRQASDSNGRSVSEAWSRTLDGGLRAHLVEASDYMQSWPFPNQSIVIRTLVFGDDTRAHAISVTTLEEKQGKSDKLFRDCVLSFRSDRLPFGLPKIAANWDQEQTTEPQISLASQAAADAMLSMASTLKDEAPELAARCCKHAISLGAVKAYGRLGKLVEAGALGDVPADALTALYRKGSDLGDQTSTNRLTRPREGASVEDKKAAFELAEKAVRDGGAPEMFKRLCEMIDDGSYLPDDPEQKRFWREARPWIPLGMLWTFTHAKNGSAYECKQLAYVLKSNGDIDGAVKWYERACAPSHRDFEAENDASIELAVIFADKNGRHYDKKRSLALFKAHKGFKSSQQEEAYRSVKGWF
jgi:hypothetical protein